MINLSLLEQIEQFATLKPQTLGALSDLSFRKNYLTGISFVIEGLPAEFCYFILSGHVRALRMNPDGRTQVLARFSAGSPLNLISLLSPKKTNRATLETITNSDLLILDAAAFNRLINTYPDFSVMILQEMAKRMTHITNLASDLSLHTVRARLAKFLIEIADNPQPYSGWTQDEIAAHIGSVRDVVGRLLREFESESLIKRDRQQITLLDRVKLFHTAEGFDQTE
jgi:CRP/FNR family transcriptional regulator